jgi:hypothetical protein
MALVNTKHVDQKLINVKPRKTPAQAFRNGLLKVDVPIVQELHTFTTLLGPVLLCQWNNAMRHT